MTSGGIAFRPQVRTPACPATTVPHRTWRTPRPPLVIGVGKGVRPPRPPNRTGGFPASGSPVGGFFIETVSQRPKLCVVRTARGLRRTPLASADGRHDRGRERGASPACAERRGAAFGSSGRACER